MTPTRITAKYTQSTLRAASVGTFLVLRTAYELGDTVWCASQRVLARFDRVLAGRSARLEQHVQALEARYPGVAQGIRRLVHEHGVGSVVLALSATTAWQVATGAVQPLLAGSWICAGVVLGGLALGHKRRAHAFASALQAVEPRMQRLHERLQFERQARRRGYVELVDVDALDDRALCFVRERCLDVARAAEAELETRRAFDFSAKSRA